MLRTQISYKYGICSLFTGKCNSGVVLEWDICTLFLSPTMGILNELPGLTVGHLQLFQKKRKKNRNAQKMSVGEGGGHP